MQWLKSSRVRIYFKALLVVSLVIGLYLSNDQAEVFVFDENSYHDPKLLDDAFRSGVAALGISNDVFQTVNRQGVYVKYLGRFIDGSLYFNVLDEFVFYIKKVNCVVYDIRLSSEQLALMKKTLSSGDEVKGGKNTLTRMVNICSQYNSLAPSTITSKQIIGYKEVGVVPIGGNPWSDPFHGSYWWFIPIVEKEISDGATIKLVAFNQRDWAHPVRIGR